MRLDEREAEIAKVKQMLDDARKMRDMHPYDEIRAAYNAACDKLDVLHSKLNNNS
jgi:hypothetical protein